MLPGGIILLAYFRSQLIEELGGSDGHSGVTIVCALAAAWLLGIGLEIVDFTLPAVVIKNMRKWTGLKLFEWLEKTFLENNQASSGDRVYEKFRAEKILFRHMAVISLLTAVCYPKAIPPWERWEWNYWYGLVGAIVWGGAWLYAVFNPVPTGHVAEAAVRHKGEVCLAYRDREGRWRGVSDDRELEGSELVVELSAVRARDGLELKGPTPREDEGGEGE